jgi:hypothetical protein
MSHHYSGADFGFRYRDAGLGLTDLNAISEAAQRRQVDLDHERAPRGHREPSRPSYDRAFADTDESQAGGRFRS